MISLTHAHDHIADAPDGLRVLTLDAPPEHRWDSGSLEELHRVLAGLARETPAPPLVITGSGSEWFCGGTLASAMEHDAPVSASQLARLYIQAFGVLRRYPAVTVAALNGRVRDEGLALALSCDFRVAAGAVRIGFDAPGRGHIPMGGSTQLLPRLVGESLSKRLMLCGLEWGATEAEAAGLVDEVVEGAVVAAAAALVAPACELRPLVVQGIRQLVEHARMRPLETGFALERDWQLTVQGEDPAT